MSTKGTLLIVDDTRAELELLRQANAQLQRELAERKQAELEIQRQAAFPRFNPNPVLELSAAGEIAYLNEAAREMAIALGLETPARMLPPNTPAMLRECLATGKSKLRVETQIGPRVISWSFFPVKINNTVHCYAGDITERKQSEELLRQRVKLQDQLVYTAVAVPGMIYSLLMRPDGTTRMPYVSGALSDIFDLQPKDLVEDAAPVFSMIHPDDLGHVLATIAESARTLNPWRDDFRVCHTRLGEIWVEGHSVPQREPDGSTLWHGFIQNITKRKETEIALVRLAAIVESSDDAIISKDLNSIITSWNKGAEKLFGYTASEMMGTSIMRLVPADRQEEENQILGKITRGESTGHFETLRKGKGGRLVEVSVTASPIRDATGKVIGVSKVARDFTARKQAEEALRRSETKFRTLYDSTNDAVMLLDQRGFFDCNHATLTMFGCASREEFCAKHPGDVSPPLQPDGTDSRTLAAQRIATAMDKGGHCFEWMHKRADTGDTFPAEVLLSAMELDGKTVLQAVVRDITERKRSEESLRLQSAALEAAANAIVITDRNGTIQWVNPAFTALTGFTSQEAIGQNPRVLKSSKHDEAFYRKLWQTISSGQVWSGELTNRRKDGSLYVEEMTITPLRDAYGVFVRYIAIKQDITERKRTAETLRQSEEQFRAMFDLASVGIAQADPHTGQWLRVNQKMCKLTGYSSGELLQMRVPDITHPEDRQLDREAFERVVRGEAPDYRMEKRYVRKDGALAWVNVNMTLIRDAAGQPTRTMAAIEDITERKQAEEELRRISDLLLRTGELARVGGWELDLRAMKLFWSLETCRIHEVDPPVAPALDQAINFYAPEARTVIRAAVQAGIDTGAPFDLDLPLTTANERHIWVRAQGSAVMEDGKAAKLVGTFQDITERKRSEEELREKEQLLSEAQRLGHIGSWLYDPTGPMRWSEELYRVYGVSPGTFTPTEESLLGLIYPDDRLAVQAWMAACAGGEKPGESEFRINLPDGTIRWIRGHGDAVYDAGNRLTHIAGTAQDITERKVAETKLAELHKRLLDASREAGMAEIATSVLHNVGNVLNSLNVSTGLVGESVKKSRASSLSRVVELLQEHAHDLGVFITQDFRGKHVPAHLAQLAEHLRGEQEANVRELESLRRNVEHIKQIVAMQQNYASFGGVKEMISVVQLVEDSLRINEGAFTRHELEVIREFGDVPPLNVEKHKILQILVNLLRNAKYACDESGRADKRLTVRVAKGAGRVRISVIDNGVGIPPENLTRIFNHGFTTRKQGHGFGLHSGALAAKEMGGSLTVHSDGPGQGASFTLELPLPEAGEAP